MRRRRTRGTWLPTIGTEVVALEDTAAGRQFTINMPASSAGTITGILPVTFDTPFEGEAIAPGVDSLADIIGSEYVLQRIVGKLFIERRAGLSPGAGVDDQPAVLVGCGFFVARANDANSGGGSSTPIGSATEAERRDNYSPLEVDTIREPWIWRRTWILGSAGRARVVGETDGVADISNTTFPASTALYGSVADGPHIDSRVKRRVSADNRLWFAVSVAPFPLTFETSADGFLQVLGYLDYRLFASLRKARQTSAF